MSEIRVKKSVLQSIIRKHLVESSGKRPDPSRRLTIGPDSMTIPDELPLSPSDRMSTQLEVERPPVEDPEYVPANSKELGLAVQALAELVADDQVEGVYNSFKDIVETLNADDEGEEDEDTDEESLELHETRDAKYKFLMSLLGESEEEIIPTKARHDRIVAAQKRLKRKMQAAGPGSDIYADGEEDDFDLEDDSDVGPEDDSDIDSDVDDASDLKKKIAKSGLSLIKRQRLEEVYDNNMISTQELETFLNSLAFDPVAIDVFDKTNESQLAKAIKTYISKKTKPLSGEKTKGRKKGEAAPNVSDMKVKPGEAAKLTDLHKFYGYKAESGLLQALKRDVVARRSVLTAMPPGSEIYEEIEEAYVNSLMPIHTVDPGELENIFTEDELEELRSGVVETKFGINLFKNFRALVFSNVLLGLEDWELKSGRTIKEAFYNQVFADQSFSTGPVTSEEWQEIRDLARSGQFDDEARRYIDAHESYGFVDILEVAVEIVRGDISAVKSGGHKEPALQIVKRQILPGARAQEKAKAAKAANKNKP